MLVVHLLRKLTQVLAKDSRILLLLPDCAEHGTNPDQSLGRLELGPPITAFHCQLLPLMPFFQGTFLQISKLLIVKLASFNPGTLLPLGNSSPTAEVIPQILGRNLLLRFVTVGILDLFDFLIVLVCQTLRLIVGHLNFIHSFEHAVAFPLTKPIADELAPEHALHASHDLVSHPRVLLVPTECVNVVEALLHKRLADHIVYSTGEFLLPLDEALPL